MKRGVCGTRIAIAALVILSVGCKRNRSSGSTNDVHEGVVQLAPGATVQATRRGEGHTRIPAIYDEAGTALQAQDFTRAQVLYRQAIAIEPENEQGYIGLGTALMQAGDLPGARTAYDDALARDPDSRSAHLGLGSVDSLSGQHREAVAEYSKVVRARPDDADGHWGLALEYRSLGDPANATLHARKFLELVPDSPLAPQMRAIAEGR